MLELVAKKIGMSHQFEDNGTQTPLTFIELYDNCVLDLKTNEDKEFDSLRMAFGKVEKAKKISKALAGSYKKKGLPLYKKIHNSQVRKGLELKVGESIKIESVISKGDFINISGTTIGKGFAGAMKRWNFSGLEASHGVSISHRSHGSIGQCQDPGKTFKGKKMAGHMGAAKATAKNLEVVIVDGEKSIIAIKGSIPGNKGSDVVLKIAKNYQ